MTFQPGAMVYTQGFGSRPENVEVAFIADRAPATTDVNFPIGKRWIYQGEYVLLSLSTAGGVTSATWAQTTSASGNVVAVVGTANQVTVSTSSGTATVSLPSAITAPGSLTTTTSANVGTFLSVNGGAVTDFIGTATLASGTVDVLNTSITAADWVFVTRMALNASTEAGVFQVVLDPGVKFTINSLDPTDASVATGDLSDVVYFIVRQT